MRKFWFSLLSVFFFLGANAQSCYWQQKAEYTMDVSLDVSDNTFDGTQKLVYTNNSPDTLNEVFYHLYFNAFQPGSMMDVRSRNIKDPDGRVEDRIYHLKSTEIGFQNIHKLNMNGKECTFHIEGTVLEVKLPAPIPPNSSVTFDMKFSGQVPLQIRRSGRDNKEGIRYTMTQWYPKMAEYDKEGWHANPYVGREFHGVFGTFDITLELDKDYVVGGTGNLIGSEVENGTKTWHFKAENVHDFAWAADPDFKHDSMKVENGPMLHFYYQTDTLAQQWKEIQPEVVRLFEIMNAKFGKYPYKQFSVIQGGDGGMEYPMCTMILGHGSKEGKIGLIAHESFHNWYYGVLATNEFKYPWMDEGFTSYAEDIVMDSLMENDAQNPLARSYRNVRYYSQQPFEEPMSTPADFFNTNIAYGISSYSKGSVFLHQLSYVIGQTDFDRGMKTYFDEWKFKHPTPEDFKRVMERESGLELDWYFEQFINTTHYIDYAIDTVEKDLHNVIVKLKREGTMPMPIDVKVTYKDGSTEMYYYPLGIMRGKKSTAKDYKYLGDWHWTHPENGLEIPMPANKIEKIEIDPSLRLADVDLTNNKWFMDQKKNQEYRYPKNEDEK
ncbi:M1 family metallopeptidase [Salibacter halophilus]|uniref:M1 family metallopeptidase n=1 Tax=Salibacter halophilus TaxID=1803916 RepID=A0A6N6M6R4_9FLAO|nr:M1 family metallopeptidase [Salibacter halophilus]KAB1065602.1 M1 family metallopeptidase [Salibacter halophilus]